MDNKKGKMDRFKTRRVDIAFILLILVTLAAMVNIIVLTYQYASGSSEQAVTTAESYALDAEEKFASRMDYLREKTEAVALVAGTIDTPEKLHKFLSDVEFSDGCTD